MSKYIFANILGSFVFDAGFNLIDKGQVEDAENIAKRHTAVIPSDDEIKKILEFFKRKEFFAEFHKKNIELTKRQIRNSVSDDMLIIQAIGCIEDIDKAANTLIKRLREWYCLHNPEFSEKVSSNERFSELIIAKDRKELLKEISVPEESSMGAELGKGDVAQILLLAEHLKSLYILRKKQEEYIENIMKKVCPNLSIVAGHLIGAKLIEKAGGIKRLMEFPASTVQLLGAEKALFRHMRTGARAPKHGIIHKHPLISKSKRKEHGKIARALADKISIAVKIDYFKGEFIGDRLLLGLEERFSVK